jgi:hypothetical protein
LEEPNLNLDFMTIRVVTNLVTQPRDPIYATSGEGVAVMLYEIMTFAYGHLGVEFSKHLNKRKPMAAVVRLGNEIKGET